MRSRIYSCGLLSLALCCLQTSIVSAQELIPKEPKFAGPTATGFLLPNGWHLTPAGEQIETTDMLLNIQPLSDSKRAIATCNGFNEHQMVLIDLVERKVIAKETCYQSWFGLVTTSDEKKLWGRAEVRVLSTHTT